MTIKVRNWNGYAQDDPNNTCGALMTCDLLIGWPQGTARSKASPVLGPHGWTRSRIFRVFS